MNETLEFNGQNSLYKILFEYIIQNEITVFNKKHSEISKNTIKTLILKKGVKVNSMKTYIDTHKIENGDRIQIEEMNINFICIENLNIINESVSSKTIQVTPKIIDQSIETPTIIETPNEYKIIDNFIVDFIKTELGCQNIEEIRNIDKKKVLCYLIILFEQKGFEEIKNSKYSYDLTDYIKEIFLSSHLPKELDFPKNQNSFTGKIIESIISAKQEKEDELSNILEELKAGLYDLNIYRFFQNYKKIIINDTFQYLLSPLLSNIIHTPIAIENLIKPINDGYSKKDNEPKYLLFENFKENYIRHIYNIEQGGQYDKKYFRDIANYLFDLFKKLCDATVEKSPLLNIQATSKKYNFKNSERQTQNIFLLIKNIGEGIAKNVKIKSISDSFKFEDYNVGLLKADESREISIKTNISIVENFNAELDLLIIWEEPSNNIEEKEISIKFELQEDNVPWDDLIKQSPYSIQIIEEKSKLYGRDEIIEELQINILSNVIESYKIWGQKRVGKSSIVKTLKSIFNESESTLVVYRSILGLRNPDPLKTLNDLGESICSEILIEIEKKIKSPILRDQLKKITIPIFSGSFYPLEKFILKLHEIFNDLKFIIIIDEFDRINEEFFKASDLGEGFSGSIGKALNEYRFVGFILVGSENMQLLDRQGMNYNSYLEREVDTFKKETQYTSFENIVLGPVYPHISFSDNSIERIFEVTNGNPYFTNLICKEAFKIAYKNKDSFINMQLINDAIDLIVKSSQKSHFEHFWGDGLTEESDVRKERTTDIRRRVLVSFSHFSKSDIVEYPTRSEILKKFNYPEEYKIEKYEVEYTINEFFHRRIFFEKNNAINIKPLLFEKWLFGPGKTLIIDGVSDLEALHRQIELEEEYSLKDEELFRLSETLEYKGKNISIEKYKNYFKQFGGSIEQRRIFKLLDSIYFISKDEINSFFRKEHKNIFSKHNIEIKPNTHTPYREGIETYCFDSSLNENILITDSFKVLNHIRTSKTIKNLELEGDVWKRTGADELIIIEPLIDDTSYIIPSLLKFITEEIIRKNISVRLVTLLITTKAKTSIIKATSPIPNFKLILYKEIEETKIKPFIQGTELFENSDESNQAFAEVRKKFAFVNRESSLLVLFSSICPSKSCPILWCSNSQFNPLFLNEFGKLEQNETNNLIIEERRTKLYHANVEFSQGIHKFIINHLKEKAKEQNIDNWFHVKFIPKTIMVSVNTKWVTDNQKEPIESYLDFLDYKRIIEANNELIPYFKHPSDGLKWLEKLNELRRIPSHPEKSTISEENVEDYLKYINLVLPKLR